MILSLLLLMGMQAPCSISQPCLQDEPEPLDVPAIRFKDVRRLSEPPYEDARAAWNKGQKDGCGDLGGKYDAAKRTCTVDAWTCRDKKRGLWNDEQPAPHTLYWCRKVQTGGKP